MSGVEKKRKTKAGQKIKSRLTSKERIKHYFYIVCTAAVISFISGMFYEETVTMGGFTFPFSIKGFWIYLITLISLRWLTFIFYQDREDG